mgnify:FL=1
MSVVCLKFLISLTPMPINNDEPNISSALKSTRRSPEFNKNQTVKRENSTYLTLFSTLLNNSHSGSFDATRLHANQIVALTLARNRMGNQMFQLASLIGFSATYGYIPAVSIDQFKDVFAVFKQPNGPSIRLEDSTSPDFVFKEPDADLYKERDITRLSEPSDLQVRANWTIDGYFQSYKHFQSVSKQVLQLFTFNKQFTDEATEFLEHNAEKGSIVIGIHVRRGDFLSDYHVSLGRTTAGTG